MKVFDIINGFVLFIYYDHMNEIFMNQINYCLNLFLIQNKKLK